MKQIRVTSPFLDATCSNKRREVGDMLFVTEERAAFLVSGKLCEYAEDEGIKQAKATTVEQPKDAAVETHDDQKPTETKSPETPKPSKGRRK